MFLTNVFKTYKYIYKFNLFLLQSFLSLALLRDGYSWVSPTQGRWW